MFEDWYLKTVTKVVVTVLKLFPNIKQEGYKKKSLNEKGVFVKVSAGARAVKEKVRGGPEGLQ